MSDCPFTLTVNVPALSVVDMPRPRHVRSRQVPAAVSTQVGKDDDVENDA